MSTVEICEVGPRDGYQGIGPFIPTETKLRFLERLVGAGLRRIEIGSFVSPSAVPQMRDTPEILAACARFPQIKPQVLVPSEVCPTPSTVSRVLLGSRSCTTTALR